MPSEDYESPLYVAMKKQVLEALQAAGRPLSCRELRHEVEGDEFIGDALEHLCFLGLIEDVGSLLISRYRYIGQPKVQVATKVCPNCKEAKEVIDFYLEWSGALAKHCKACKQLFARRRKPPKRTSKKSKGVSK